MVESTLGIGPYWAGNAGGEIVDDEEDVYPNDVEIEKHKLYPPPGEYIRKGP